MSSDDFWEEDDPIFKMMREMIKRMEKIFRDLDLSEENIFSGKPNIRGFSITIGPDGVPKIREFGPTTDKFESLKEEKQEIKPDIIEKDDETIIILDLPGIDEKSLQVKLENNKLLVKAEGVKKIYEYIALPSNVKGTVDKYIYNNGVLTIHIKKKKGFKLF